MPQSTAVTPEECAAKRRGTNRIQNVTLTLMALLVGCVGWALGTSIVSSAKSESVLHEVRGLSSTVEERDKKYDERNEALKKSVDEVKLQQREGFQRLSDKIDKIIP